MRANFSPQSNLGLPTRLASRTNNIKLGPKTRKDTASEPERPLGLLLAYIVARAWILARKSCLSIWAPILRSSFASLAYLISSLALTGARGPEIADRRLAERDHMRRGSFAHADTCESRPARPLGWASRIAIERASWRRSVAGDNWRTLSASGAKRNSSRAGIQITRNQRMFLAAARRNCFNWLAPLWLHQLLRARRALGAE